MATAVKLYIHNSYCCANLHTLSPIHHLSGIGCIYHHWQRLFVSQIANERDRLTMRKKERYGNSRVKCNDMLPQVKLIPGAIAEILASSSDSGVLTLTDRYGLMAILDESLDEQEQRAVNRLLRAVLRGKIKISNKIPFDDSH